MSKRRPAPTRTVPRPPGPRPAARPSPAAPSPASLSPGLAAGLREVTPELRARTLRTFGWVIVGFLAGIGLMVAALSAQGRAVRDYAGRVQAAAAAAPTPAAGRPCVEVLPGALPSGVLGCEVQVQGGQASVRLTLERGREYRLGPGTPGPSTPGPGSGR